MNLIAELSEAVARGVEVTIFVGGGPMPDLHYPWVFTHGRDHGKGKYRAAGYDLVVIDYDGDQSEWEVKRHGAIIARGSDIGDGDYYHFDACLLAAEAALRADVRQRLAMLGSGR
jgi:hypothetical protein